MAINPARYIGSKVCRSCNRTLHISNFSMQPKTRRRKLECNGCISMRIEKKKARAAAKRAKADLRATRPKAEPKKREDIKQVFPKNPHFEDYKALT